MADDSDIWRELGRLNDRQTAAERSLDRHLGECSVRHAEIIRRHEESQRDRTQLRVDLERHAGEQRRVIGRAQGWIIGLLVSTLGSILLFAAGLVLKVIKI